jgi:hypothetical protein
MNNLALFVTHSIFLTKEQIENLLKKNTIDVLGCCVPVWINAKTGKTTEPAVEIFCNYKIHNDQKKSKEIEKIARRGYEIFIPQNKKWKLPPKIDYEEISKLSSEERQLFLKERDKWWFDNPKPPCIENLKNGYLRFDIKKTDQKIYKKNYMAQHVIEISDIKRLEKSLTI